MLFIATVLPITEAKWMNNNEIKSEIRDQAAWSSAVVRGIFDFLGDDENKTYYRTIYARIWYRRPDGESGVHYLFTPKDIWIKKPLNGFNLDNTLMFVIAPDFWYMER